jgi:signal transduction histidine kinase/Tfp pilus assembly protein PilF
VKHTCFFLLFFILQCRLSAQRGVDSINAVIKGSKNDTTLARCYVALTEQLFASYPDTLIPLCNKALAIVEKNIASANTQEKRSYLFTKGASLNNIAYAHFVKGRIETALDYFERGLKINEELGVKREIANSLSNISALYDQQGKPEKALIKSERAWKIQEEIGDKQGMAYTINNIAAIYDKQGKMQKALDYIHRGLKIEEEIGNKYLIATSFNNLGAFYVKQGQIEKALDYYHKSLKIREEIKDQQGIATCLHNIGYVYEVLNDNAKSLDYDLRGLKIYKEIGDQKGIANSYHNIGAIYEKLGDTKKALDYYDQSVAIYKELGDKRGLANSLNNIGSTLLKEHKAAKGKLYVQEALKTATEGSYIESTRSAHYNLAKLDSALGNMAGAFEHYKQYIFYRDSISNENTRKKALKKQLQYDYETKETTAKLEQEKKDAIREEEVKRQKLMYWSASGALLLLLLLSWLLFNRQTLKQKNKFQEQLNSQQKEQANAIMETQEQERKRIAEDLHDSLGHLLSTTKLHLQTQPVDQNQISTSLHLLNQAAEEIRNITFNLMPRTLEEEGLVSALYELAHKTTSSGLVKVLLHVHNMDHFVLEKQAQFNIYRIVQEAVNNILKHAAASEINIQVIGGEDHITIMVEDDGKGFNPENNKEGRGLKNIVTRSLWLKGSINIDSTPGRGTTITTEFPI